MTTDSDTADAEQVIARAAAAVARIDRWGARGLTMITTREIEAMALSIHALAQRVGDLETALQRMEAQDDAQT